MIHFDVHPASPDMSATQVNLRYCDSNFWTGVTMPTPFATWLQIGRDEACRGVGTSAQIEMIYAIAIQGQVLAIQDAGAAIHNAPSAIQKSGKALQGKRRLRI